MDLNFDILCRLIHLARECRGQKRTGRHNKTQHQQSSIVMLSYCGTLLCLRVFGDIERAYAEQKTTKPVSRLILIEFVGWTVGGG